MADQELVGRHPGGPGVVLTAKDWGTLAKVVQEAAMMVVLKRGDCIPLGEHSRLEIVELTEMNRERSVQAGVWELE